MTLALYLLLINAATFALYWLDKHSARRGGWRIPEASLLMSGLMGGTLAAFAAQRILRHKTRKTSFQVKFWLITALQCWILYAKPAPVRPFLHLVGVH